MLKKMILALLLVGFIGILIWGGVSRTLAKAGEGESGQTEARQSGNGHDHAEDEPCEEQTAQGNAGSQQKGNHDNLGNNAVSEHDSDQAVAGGKQGNGYRGGSGNGQGQGSSSDPLNATEIEALHMALDDEYHALAVYQSVIATFGEVDPFVEISQSEQNHIDALINQFEKHDLPVPENPWVGEMPPFESLQQACQAGATAEIANVDLYEQLFSMVDDPSLIRVFTNLSNASQNHHLPQFEACQ